MSRELDPIDVLSDLLGEEGFEAKLINKIGHF